MSEIAINLLPWREKKRAVGIQVFAAMAVAVGFCSLVTVYYVNGIFDDWTQGQRVRNSYMQKAIDSIGLEVKEIQRLESEKSKFLARLRVIDNLNLSRFKAVDSFYDLAQAVPQGIILSSVVQDGGQVKISGRANTPATVPALMRNLEQSDAFSDPTLQTLRANQNGFSSFLLTVNYV